MESERYKCRLMSSFPPTHSILSWIIGTLTKHLLSIIYYARNSKVSDLKELGLLKEIGYTDNEINATPCAGQSTTVAHRKKRSTLLV